MFTENHVSTISARYIPIALEIASAERPDQITQRSWGSAVLAATYRGMCNGCHLVGARAALLGCPLLLQLWSWERFSIGRPDVGLQESWPVHELFDVDGIDMTTFGLCWTRRQVCFVLKFMEFLYVHFGGYLMKTNYFFNRDAMLGIKLGGRTRR